MSLRPQPFITLAEGLGRAAVSLVADSGFTDINITYSSPRGVLTSADCAGVQGLQAKTDLEGAVVRGWCQLLRVRFTKSRAVAWHGLLALNTPSHLPGAGDDLDTRLLRANVLKGVLEGTTTAKVNLVNADLLAKNRGLKWVAGSGVFCLGVVNVGTGSWWLHSGKTLVRGMATHYHIDPVLPASLSPHPPTGSLR